MQITTPTAGNVVWHGINAIPDMVHQDYVNLATAYPRAKFVRVMVDEGCWDPFFVAGQTTSFCRQLGGSASYQANVKSAVADIVSHGQVAMLLANNAGRDNPNWYPKVIADDFGPDQHTLALYHALDQLYPNNPRVIFETTNEPKMNVGQRYAPNNIEGARCGSTAEPPPLTTSPGTRLESDGSLTRSAVTVPATWCWPKAARGAKTC